MREDVTNEGSLWREPVFSGKGVVLILLVGIDHKNNSHTCTIKYKTPTVATHSLHTLSYRPYTHLINKTLIVRFIMNAKHIKFLDCIYWKWKYLSHLKSIWEVQMKIKEIEMLWWCCISILTINIYLHNKEKYSQTFGGGQVVNPQFSWCWKICSLSYNIFDNTKLIHQWINDLFWYIYEYILRKITAG